jgi:hypothetical protein
MGLFDHEEPIATDDPVDKNRLFETLKEESESSRNYFRLFSIVAVLVLAAILAAWFILMPGIGDQVRAPEGLEDAMREHFRSVEKRTANEITFYKCNGYYWAHVEVEVRPDIQTDPKYGYSSYRAKAAGDGVAWQIAAQPITSPDQDVPCDY